MQDLPLSVAKDHTDVEQTKRRCDDHKHIDGGDAVDLIAQKGPVPPQNLIRIDPLVVSNAWR